jgi:putative peptidoglycan lipid II flippase
MAQVAWAAVCGSILTGALAALHHCRRTFVRPTLAGYLPYVGMLVAMLVGPRRLGPAVLPWGMLAGYSVAAAILLPGTGISGWGRRWPSRTALARIASAGTNLPLVTLSALGFASFGTIDAIVATPLGPGALSYLAYGQRLVIAIGNLVVLGPAIMLVPVIADAMNAGDRERARACGRRNVAAVLVLSLTVALVVGWLRKPVVTLLLERGAFDESMTAGLVSVLPWMLAGMVPMLGCVVVFRVFFAHRNFPAPALVGLAVPVVYFASAKVLSGLWGVRGIAAGYAAVWTVALAVSLHLLRRCTETEARVSAFAGRPALHKDAVL